MRLCVKIIDIFNAVLVHFMTRNEKLTQSFYKEESAKSGQKDNRVQDVRFVTQHQNLVYVNQVGYNHNSGVNRPDAMFTTIKLYSYNPGLTQNTALFVSLLTESQSSRHALS